MSRSVTKEEAINAVDEFEAFLAKDFPDMYAFLSPSLEAIRDQIRRETPDVEIIRSRKTGISRNMADTYGREGHPAMDRYYRFSRDVEVYTGISTWYDLPEPKSPEKPLPPGRYRIPNTAENREKLLKLAEAYRRGERPFDGENR